MGDKRARKDRIEYRSFLMRTIIEEKNVTDKICNQFNDYPRFDKAYRGLQWRLSKEPEKGFSLEKYGFPNKYLYKTRPNIAGISNITVIYEYDNLQVKILFIRIS